MKRKSSDPLIQNKAFTQVALGTLAILSIPLIMMQVNDEWDLNFFDFAVIGTLLFGMGSLFVVVSRMVNKKYRVLLGIAFFLITLYIWAELAVGIFTNLGS